MRFERTILAIGALGAVAVGAPAFAALTPADAMALCSRLATNGARLECYDQVAKDMAEGRIQAAPAQSAAAPTLPAPAPSQSWAPPPPPAGVTASGPSWAAPPPPSGQAASPAAGPATSGFGSQDLRRSSAERRSDGDPESIQAEVQSSTDNGLQQWRISLADGAIWQMTERVSMFRPPAPHELVTIRKGALGGFLMDVGKQASVRVMRIK